MFNLFLFFIVQSFGGLVINAKLVNKKGMDNGFVIESESHFLKEFQGKMPLEYKTKGGLRLELTGYFLDQNETYGPSEYVVFQGDLYDKAGNPLEIFGKKPFLLRLNEEKKFESKKGKGQILEFTLKPEVN